MTRSSSSLVLALAVGFAVAQAEPVVRTGHVNVAVVDGSINPASSDYLQKAIAESEDPELAIVPGVAAGEGGASSARTWPGSAAIRGREGAASARAPPTPTAATTCRTSRPPAPALRVRRPKGRVQI